MDQDENAYLRRRLTALGKAIGNLFVPYSPAMNTNQNDERLQFESSNHGSEYLTWADGQPRYRGGWRNLASVVSLGGSVMFGASFNLLSRSTTAFVFMEVFGIVLMLVGVWATAKHDAREQQEQAWRLRLERDRDAARERGRRIRNVADKYVEIMRQLDRSTVRPEDRLEFIVNAGIGTLRGEIEMEDALDLIREHGMGVPPLRKIQDKLDPF